MRRMHLRLPALLALLLLSLGGPRSAGTAPPAVVGPDGDLGAALRASVAGRVSDGYRAVPSHIELSAPPGRTVTAQMRLINTGTTTWRGTYGLLLVGGEAVGLPPQVLLPDVPPGETLEVPVVITAPAQPGRHRAGTWVMRNAAGLRFGPALTVSVRAGSGAAASTPTAVAAGTPSRPAPTLVPSASPTPVPRASSGPTASGTAGPSATPAPLFPTAISSPTAIVAGAPALPVPLASPTPTVAPRATTPAPTATTAATGAVVVAAAHHVPGTGGFSTLGMEAGSPASAGAGARTWSFGGSALDGRDRQDLAFLNLGSRAAHVWITIAGDDGGRAVAYVTVGPLRLRRLSLNGLRAPVAHAGVDVQSDRDLVVERIVSHANDLNEGTAGSVTPGWARRDGGTMGAARGPVLPGEAQTVTLSNLTAQPATALVRFPSARGPGPAARITLRAGEVRGMAPRQAFGGVLVASQKAGIMLDESTHYGGSNGLTALPPSSPSRRWYFAPTIASTGGHSYVTILNPAPAAAQVTVTEENGSGGDPAVHISVPGGAERSIEPARILPLHAADRWLIVDATAPVLVSRITLLPPGDEKGLARVYQGSLAAAGSTGSARRIAFAAGDTSRAGGAETLFLFNPGSSVAGVSVTYLTRAGRGAAQGIILQPGGAAVLRPADLVGQTLHGILVEAAAPVAAAMLWQVNAGVYANESTGVALDAPR